MKKRKKTFVLDTNVLLHTPHALFSFADNNVVIPEVVLEELDKFKKDSTELGANARHVARLIDGLREKGNLNKGIKLDNATSLSLRSNLVCDTENRPRLSYMWFNPLPITHYLLPPFTHFMNIVSYYGIKIK